ncbi:MAG: ADP-ribosylglycohydrolase family protein [Terrimicrobiaceae bacterium]
MGNFAEKVTGILFGLAAGDRIGGPVRMAIRVAASLHDKRGFAAEDIGERYRDWWRAGAFDTGPTVARVLRLVECGASFPEAACRVDHESGGMTAGCNPAHRSAPLAMCAEIEDSSLARAALIEAQLTHRHPLAGETAAAVACLCRSLIRGVPWSVALGQAAAGRISAIRAALEPHSVAAVSRSGFAPAALAAAIHFVDKADCFRTALVRSIDFAGPANYCPVLVGSIGGARWGLDQIEESSFCHHGELVQQIRAVAGVLAKSWWNGDANPDDA